MSGIPWVMQGTTLFVRLKVDMSVGDVNTKHLSFECQVCTCTQLHVRGFDLKRVACAHNVFHVVHRHVFFGVGRIWLLSAMRGCPDRGGRFVISSLMSVLVLAAAATSWQQWKC